MSGTVTLTSEITNITKDGLWLLTLGDEYFVSFQDYPVLEHATIKQLNSFFEISPGQFHWADLDCDIELDALKHPEHFQLGFVS